MRRMLLLGGVIGLVGAGDAEARKPWLGMKRAEAALGRYSRPDTAMLTDCRRLARNKIQCVATFLVMDGWTLTTSATAELAHHRTFCSYAFAVTEGC